PQYFAVQVMRAMAVTNAAQEIGAAAAYLVTQVAITEDALRYSGPAVFYRDQLMRMIGLGNERTFRRARDQAVAAGWLQYIEPPQGSRQPGKYWAMIPQDARQNGSLSEPN